MSCVSCTAIIMCSSLQDGRSSLMIASQNGHNQVVKVLLSAGIEVDLQDGVSILRPNTDSTQHIPQLLITTNLHKSKHHKYNDVHISF